MAAFVQNIKETQSADCKTLTFEDLTNWLNDEGYLKSDFSRTIILRNANDEVLATLVIPADADTVSFQVTKDFVAKYTYLISGPSQFQIDRVFALTCFVDLLFEEITRKDGCSCNHSETSNALNNSRNLLRAAATNVKYGEHELAEDKIQKASIILADHNCNC